MLFFYQNLSQPLILSRQALNDSSLQAIFGCNREKLNIVATYNLLFNGSLMVDEGMGYAVCLDKIINVSGESNLCFRPFEPETTASLSLVWKKYQVLTKASEKFLMKCRELMT